MEVYQILFRAECLYTGSDSTLRKNSGLAMYSILSGEYTIYGLAMRD